MALSVSSAVFASSNAAAATRRNSQVTPGFAPPVGISSRVALVTGLSLASRSVLARRNLVQAAVATEAPTAIPSSAQTAKTIVELVGSGTLSTVDASGIPLGTYVTYVLGADGIPILRLRSSAVHTDNLKANPSCSLFIHAPLQPIRSVARITLIGAVEEISAEEQAEAKEQHAAAMHYAIGVDAPSDDDIFMKLNVSRTFYVGGLGTECKAEEIDVAAYATAEADGLAEFAPELVSYMNGERRMDVLRITGGAVEDATIDDVEDAELLWVDTLGVYIRAVVRNEERVVRANFMHEAIDRKSVV